jgi:hypothetical protein
MKSGALIAISAAVCGCARRWERRCYAKSLVTYPDRQCPLADQTFLPPRAGKLRLTSTSSLLQPCGAWHYKSHLPSFLLYYFTTLLLYYFTTLLLYYFTTLLLYYFTTLLLYYFTFYFLPSTFYLLPSTSCNCAQRLSFQIYPATADASRPRNDME